MCSLEVDWKIAFTEKKKKIIYYCPEGRKENHKRREGDMMEKEAAS